MFDSVFDGFEQFDSAVRLWTEVDELGGDKVHWGFGLEHKGLIVRFEVSIRVVNFGESRLIGGLVDFGSG